VGVGPQEWSQAYALEREIERKFKVRHAVAVNSGTAALHAALVALDVRGREVVTTPYSFSATVAAIRLAGGTPRFADVDPDHFCITKETVKRVITKRTAAIVPVHLFGYFPDLGHLQSFGIPIVEDACQAVGAERTVSGTAREPKAVDAGRPGRRYSGTVGLAGVYSFNGSKNLPSGEGGCLVTNDDKIAEKARAFINHQENFGSQEVGVNYRMHEVVAVLARHGLRELDERNERRVDLAMAVMMGLAGYGSPFGVYPGNESRDHVFYVAPFTLRGVDRAKFIKRCAKRGLTVGGGYINPTLDKYPAFKKYVTTPLPVVHELSEKTLCLLTTLTPEKPLSYARKVATIIRESLE